MKEAQASSAMAAVEKSFAAGSPMEEEAPLSKPDAFDEQSRARISPAVIEASTVQLADSGSSPQPSAETPNRCFSCRKRVGLTGFKCRCGNTFCGLHRYAEKHSCSLDFKAAKNPAAMNPDRTVSDVKRLLGRKFENKEVQRDRVFHLLNLESENASPMLH